MQPFMLIIRPAMLVKTICRTVEHACVYAVVISAIASVHIFYIHVDVFHIETRIIILHVHVLVCCRCSVPGNQIQSLMRAIKDQLRSTEAPPDMVLCLLPGNQEERYNTIKRYLECERPGERFS